MHTITNIAEIKDRLSAYADMKALRRSEKDARKIREIFRVICTRHLAGRPVWMRDLLKSSSLPKIGNRYIMAAVWWLAERGYITRERVKEGRKSRILLRSSFKARWLSFILSLDLDANIFKPDLSDLWTGDMDFAGFFLDAILLEKTDTDMLIHRIMNHSDQSIREEVLERLRRRIEIYEEETKRCKKLITVMQSIS